MDARPLLPRPAHMVNEGLAFLFELAALGALAWWGFQTDAGLLIRFALGLGAPLAAAVLWGLFAAPKARFRVPLAGVLAVKVLVFGAAVAAVYAIGHPVLAFTFAVLLVVNTTLATIDRGVTPRS